MFCSTLKQWRVHDFPEGVRQLPTLAENCMKIKELDPQGGSPWRPLRSANVKATNGLSFEDNIYAMFTHGVSVPVSVKLTVKV